jgi:hypothetical protein
MQKSFTDMHGRPICDGAEIHYTGTFPAGTIPERQVRNGIAVIKDGFLNFAILDNKHILRGTGLYWEFDDEPCYDLILIEEEEILCYKEN